MMIKGLLITLSRERGAASSYLSFSQRPLPRLLHLGHADEAIRPPPSISTKSLQLPTTLVRRRPPYAAGRHMLAAGHHTLAAAALGPRLTAARYSNNIL